MSTSVLSNLSVHGGGKNKNKNKPGGHGWPLLTPAPCNCNSTWLCDDCISTCPWCRWCVFGPGLWPNPTHPNVCVEVCVSYWKLRFLSPSSRSWSTLFTTANANFVCRSKVPWYFESRVMCDSARLLVARRWNSEGGVESSWTTDNLRGALNVLTEVKNFVCMWDFSLGRGAMRRTSESIYLKVWGQ